MKKFILTAQAASLILFGFLTLCILGAEPSDVSETGLGRYESSAAYWTPILLWSWLGSLVAFLSFSATKFFKKISA